MRCKTLLVVCLAASPLAAADAYRCDDPLFMVDAASPEFAQRTCQSATEARADLALCGVHLIEPLTITVVESIDGVVGSCLGLYHCGEGRIEILSPKSMAVARKPDGAFAGIAEDALWDSVLVHELTHAAYQQVNCPFSSCIATSEYAGYAMQVRSLPPQELERFGEMVDLKGTPNSDAISALMFFMAPERFAKFAWLHFSAQPDPCGYMELIMKGNIFFDKERP